MHRTFMFVVLITFVALAGACGQTGSPEKAEKVLTTALQQAGGAHKTVLLIFHASWCGWCKRLDAALESAELKSIMDEHYVIIHLDVMENAAKKGLENPGGNEMLAKYGGAKSGIPFFVFFDAAGKKLADSNVMPKDQNIGYPGSPEEIVGFEKLLTQTAARMTEEQRGRIVAYFKKNAPR
jgi:thioredoxin-related protein